MPVDADTSQTAFSVDMTAKLSVEFYSTQLEINSGFKGLIYEQKKRNIQKLAENSWN